jgi:hypothetical protein
MKQSLITQADVHSFFSYREDGELIRKVKLSDSSIVGSVAGCVNALGYKVIRIKPKLYLAHRLIWLYHNGYFPENQIDHINRDRLDNRIENLREVSTQCNLRNSKQQSNNSSGVRGVGWFAEREKWKAYIKVNRKNIFLGDHADFMEAVCHRLAAEQCINWVDCNETSPASLYVSQNIR